MTGTTMQPNKDHYAIVIGIDNYVQINPLHSAKKDAMAFGEWLASPEGGNLPTKNIKTILCPEIQKNDPYLAEPIKDNIDKACRDIGFEKNSKIGQRLYFYFAGHGFGPDFDDVCMLMANAAMVRLSYNIGLRAYRSYLREHILFNEIIFILDCCRDRERNPRVKRGEPPWTLDEAVTIGENNSVQDFVILAAVYGAKAFEPNNRITGEPRGLLTQALLEGLKDPAAADHSGRVTSLLLSNYLKSRLPQMSGDEKLRQKPDIIPPNDDIVICHIPLNQSSRVKVQIMARAGLTGDILLFGEDKPPDNLDNPLNRFPAEHATHDTPWEIALAHNALYVVKHSEAGFEYKFNTQDITEEPYIIRIL